ncbi:unnamed protein product [Acanthoscelides obtectus]|uniref:HTH psq-type domain-containing protein n=1 Tax=Acanthoscelides obtectus TaxID=200917 RepID=A0A9P0P2K5_ACAOB|nr:unnamed protein product [Acanthoscelides obtectus]CAK1640402.1 hypothetical protein AOBTE_LOCUS11704 [Acanthoscelides obtectus]
MAGKHWVQHFAARNTLSLRAPEKCSLGRAIGFNKVQCQRLFENFKIVYEKLKRPPHRIFSMDETGLSTVPNKLPNVYAYKGKKTVSNVVSGERGQLVTAVCCMSAGGTWVPPGLIFSRKRMKEELFFGAPPGTLKMISDSDFVPSEVTDSPHLELAQETQSEIESSVEESSSDDDCTLAEVRNTIIKENLKLTEEKQSTIPEPQSSDVTKSTAYFKAAPKELSEPGVIGETAGIIGIYGRFTFTDMLRLTEMPTTYKRKYGERAKWSADSLRNAIECVQNRTMGVNEAARQFGIPKTALKDRIKKGDAIKQHRLKKCFFVNIK